MEQLKAKKVLSVYNVIGLSRVGTTIMDEDTSSPNDDVNHEPSDEELGEYDDS